MDPKFSKLTDSSYGESSEVLVSGAAMVIFFLLAIYINAEAVIEAKKPIIGHATTVVILVGMLVSFIGSLIDKDFDEDFKF